MMKRLWLILIASTFVLTAPYFMGSAQDLEDTENEPAEEDDYGLEAEFLPILETAAENGSLETLLKLLKLSGLDSVLQGDGPFTLLAPDDSAFAQLQPKQLEKLMSDKEYLKAVLSKHIVAGHRVVFGDEPETLTMKCLKGDVITAEITEDGVQIEHAWVVEEQIECGNGVIHVIDAVLLPPRGQQKG
jgi:uncharacterized surface protein with fasciclin (FAS1) repeats